MRVRCLRVCICKEAYAWMYVQVRQAREYVHIGPAYVGVCAQIHEYAHVPIYPRAHTCKGTHMYVCPCTWVAVGRSAAGTSTDKQVCASN